jgi:hypothetical protein
MSDGLVDVSGMLASNGSLKCSSIDWWLDDWKLYWWIGASGRVLVLWDMPNRAYRNDRVKDVMADGTAVAIGSRMPIPPKVAGK